MARAKSTRFISPEEGALTVFTDGSSLSGPRRGGIGIRFIYNDTLGNETARDSFEAGFVGATNNQMELMAVVTAMKDIQSRRFPPEMLDPATKIDVYTDSQYVADNVAKALFVWPKSGWMTNDGPPVQNAAQWKDFRRELIKLRKLKPVTIEWGKGHSSDNPHNAAADKLAKESAKRATRPALVPGTVRRKKTSKLTDKGSVEMLGQRLTIRIVSADYLSVQKLHKYRYEVMSPRSPFFGNVDIAYSDDALMRPGHVYRVSMGKDPKNPLIAKRHLEVT
jgi:ribonuclease HI